MAPDQLHRLILLYLSVAYKTDHHFDPLERQAVIKRASRWAPDLEVQQLREIVDAAFTVTRTGHAVEVDTLAQEVGAMLSPDQRLHVLTDLGQVARADGYLSVGEASIISRIRAIWGGL